MLYTEDTYEIDEYPYFGYMRGAYTKYELKDLDKYAISLGIELIPCIQTLGHLKMALRWPFADAIKDRPDILLCDEPEAYKFIEGMLKTCRECFSTNKIHIGMDEAHDVGLGKYMDKHGFQNRFDILSRHLEKVKEMADKYGFEPMMWSDMFFRLTSETGDYYDMNAVVSEDVRRKIPNVTQVYWDYYHEDINTYRTLLEKHIELGQNVVFAGGIWTWQGMGINYAKTLRTTVPALKACREADISDVFATMWGDDGGEVNVYSALLGMQLFSECANNEDVSEEQLRERFFECTGYDMESFKALEIDDYPSEWCHASEALTISKQALCQDILLGLFDKNFEGIDLKGHYKSKLENLKNIEAPAGLEALFNYHRQLLMVLIQKCDMGLRITEAYKKFDVPKITVLISELETLYKDIEILHQKFRILWLSTNKPFGLDRADLRFGGLLARVKAAIERLTDFSVGKIEKIEELEVPRLMFGGDDVKAGKSLVNCQAYNAIAIPASDGV